ncbi:hypothetical protein BDY19DRAFT_935555 [Irpex rosettiformis]|uniref:Uncharacterized protein n=1 Tax=Irpex rosettiformis TaxID=378272 RepID=A0ACB8U864_9APHY|nr:hypothetical protein BDY19DRAFT_935555 [Irpex rosettiformis]
MIMSVRCKAIPCGDLNPMLGSTTMSTSSSQSWIVFYYVLGTLQPPRDITISPNNYVATLIREIRRDFCLHTKTVLELFKVDRKVLRRRPEEIEKEAEELLRNSTLEDLLPVCSVKESFSDSDGKPSVVVRTRTVHDDEAAERADVLSPLRSEVQQEQYNNEREKLAAIVLKDYQSPSQAAKLSSWIKKQTGTNANPIYNGRPYEFLPPPIVIAHPIFARFMGLQSGCSPSVPPLSPSETNTAYKLYEVLLNFYNNEGDRQNELRNTLDILGQAAFLDISLFVDSNKRFFPPDGAITSKVVLSGGRHATVVICLQELKNEVGEDGTDLIRQAEYNYQVLVSSKEYADVRKASCCPIILLVVAGPNIWVYGAAFMGLRFITECLGSCYVVQSLSASSEQVTQLAWLLRALEVSCQELLDYYSTLSFEDTTLSWRPHFNKYRKEDGTEVELVYLRQLAANFASKSLYEAYIKGNPSDRVVVKFTSTYSRQAHELLAQAQLAPALQFCEQVPEVGNLYVVVMDYVKHDIGVLFHPAALREAINLLHKHGLVHGDLRRPNVLVVGNGVRLIDFDWSGKSGEVRYPETILLEEHEWHPDVDRCGPIEKEHDAYMFEKLTGETL